MKKKGMIRLTYQENRSMKSKFFYIRKKEFNTDKNNGNAFKLYHKVRDRCHYTGKYRGTALVI